MSITILIERQGIRAHRTVYDSVSTRIPGVHKIHWTGTPIRTDREYYSLTHLETGRALNKIPLTSEECDRLVDALMDCPIEWERIVDGRTAKEFYAERLTAEAERIAGVY